jgi:hypothetical protein
MKLKKIDAGHYVHESGQMAVCRNTAGFWYVSVVSRSGEKPSPLTLHGNVDGRYVSPTKRGAAAVLAWEIANGRASA